jgi:hypothetical protein
MKKPQEVYQVASVGLERPDECPIVVEGAEPRSTNLQRLTERVAETQLVNLLLI